MKDETELRIANYELQNMASGGADVALFAMSAAAAPMMPPTSPCFLWPKSFNTESTEILRVLCVGPFQGTEITEKATKKL
jgi:hypothetical protein